MEWTKINNNILVIGKEYMFYDKITDFYGYGSYKGDLLFYTSKRTLMNATHYLIIPKFKS